MSEVKRYIASQGPTEYLLTIYPDGAHELATRKIGGWSSWLPPMVMQPVEDCDAA